jgi:hypothetical protein
MRLPGPPRYFVGVSLLLLFALPATAADPTGVQFFEQKIRPVLVRNCYSCHSAEAKKVRGGLRLDSRAGLLKGGDSGPAIVPGKVADSPLIRALHNDGLAMPPKGKLPDGVVADFERWVRMGAPDPRDAAATATARTIDVEAGRAFWAFQPPRHHPVPTVADAGWPRGDIDRFILAALEAKGLRPVGDADRATLIRRATIDLTGLPPTPEEIDTFVGDPAPGAFARVVDRLLASPHYGERWGRHWLDVARYADSNGKDENYVFHEAFRYRDYVIDSFNRDKPYDRFVTEQIAGDLLPAADQAQRDEQLTGTGFLVIGPKVLADRDTEKRLMDVVDEQVDTIGRTFLGLTVGCARCHDHKFDPIPQADYYALAGIFTNTRTLYGTTENPVISGWMVRPLGADGGARLAAVKEHKKKLADVAERLKKARAELKTHEDTATMRQPGKLVGITVDDKEAKLVGKWKPSTFSRPYVGEGYIHDDKSGKGEKSATFTPDLPRAGEYDVLISYTAAKGRSTNTPVTVRCADGETTVLVNQEEVPPLDGLFRPVGKFHFAAGTAGSVTIANKGTAGYVIVDAVRFVPMGALANVPATAMGVPAEVREKIAQAEARVKDLEAEEKSLQAAAPQPPPLVLAVQDEDKVGDCRINVRGNPHSLGDPVPRGFLTVATAGARPAIPADRSGRLELARWVADPGNPLTARVLVNRVWEHLFGEGLVRSVDNFGAQGERPSHPELLDELAVRFMADGWSVKKLIRTIVLSRAYQLAVANDPRAAKADPEERLLWRAQRRRVEAEVIRDAILVVSGRLDPALGGSSVAALGDRAIDNMSKGGVQVDGNTRRSVYLPVIRNEVPQIFEVFDFADPDVATGKRDATTVPTQALYLMNSPFVLDQARQAAKRLLALPADDAGRLADLYRRALGRAPTRPETEQALRFLDDYRRAAASRPKAEPDVDAWSAVCLAVFGCTEFRFVE